MTVEVCAVDFRLRLALINDFLHLLVLLLHLSYVAIDDGLEKEKAKLSTTAIIDARTTKLSQSSVLSLLTSRSLKSSIWSSRTLSWAWTATLLSTRALTDLVTSPKYFVLSSSRSLIRS